MFEITTYPCTDGITIIACTGKLVDDGGPEKLEQALLEVSDSICRAILLDLTDVSFIGINGIRAIYRANEVIARKSKQFVIAMTHDRPRSFLPIAPYPVPIFNDLSSAQESLILELEV